MSVMALPSHERDFRGPGCTEACITVQAIVPGRYGRTELLLHSPDAHEEFGRITGSVGGTWIVLTGALQINLLAREVTAYGEPVHLTAREWAIVDYLARHLGLFRTWREIIAACWGAEYATDDHLLRVNLARLRARLRGCAALIEGAHGRGYRLIRRPVWLAGEIPAPPPRPWARAYACCRDCGTTERVHAGHGRCDRCRSARNRQRGTAPCSPG